MSVADSTILHSQASERYESLERYRVAYNRQNGFSDETVHPPNADVAEKNDLASRPADHSAVSAAYKLVAASAVSLRYYNLLNITKLFSIELNHYVSAKKLDDFF